MTPKRRKQLINFILEAFATDIYECRYCGMEFVDDEGIDFPVCNQLECQLWLMEGSLPESKNENS